MSDKFLGIVNASHIAIDQELRIKSGNSHKVLILKQKVIHCVSNQSPAEISTHCHGLSISVIEFGHVCITNRTIKSSSTLIKELECLFCLFENHIFHGTRLEV